MFTVSIHEAKAHLSSLISRVERTGEKVIIKRHGRAVVEINPVSHKSRLRVNSTLKKIKIIGDLTSDTLEEWEHV